MHVKIVLEIDTNIVLITEFGEKSLKLLEYSHHWRICSNYSNFDI